MPTSIAKYEFRNCQDIHISDTFETKTGRITIRGYGQPPPAKYDHSELVSEDATYNLKNGPQEIKPGKYKHTVSGTIYVFGQPCEGKLWSVISEIRYDEN